MPVAPTASTMSPRVTFSVVTCGYMFGSVPWVKAHLDKIIWTMILIPGVLVLYGAWKARRKPAAPTSP